MTRGPAVFTWYGMVSTVACAGTFSKMPGTVGTAVALVFFLLTGYAGALMILAITAIGALAADKYSRASGRDDPGEVVIDEVAGFLMSVYGLDRGYAISAFFLFRVVDILKPFPVNVMERLPGGIGVMADDVCGGVIVNLILRASAWLVFSGGWDAIFKFLGIGG